MNDVLKGMTTAEARELVAACDGLSDNGGSRDKLLALAALGAEVVGAKEFTEERWGCPECGIAGRADEDHRCVTCGADCVTADCRVLVLEGE